MSNEEDALSSVLARLRLTAGLFTEATLCGSWAVDTSGQRMSTFHLVQSGDCWLRLNDEAPRRLHAGDLVMFPRDDKHLIASSEEVPDSVVVNDYPPIDPALPTTEMLCGYFEFRGRIVWPLLDSLPDVLVVDMNRSRVSETRPLLQLLSQEAGSENPGRQAVLDLLVEVLFVHALRSHIATDASVGVLRLFAEPRIGKALSQMHSNPGEAWTVATLAEAAGMSRASFSRKFTEIVADTPMNYVNKWRMQVAMETLATGERSVAQIAEDVGFGSEASFRRAFRTIVGETPASFRRNQL